MTNLYLFLFIVALKALPSFKKVTSPFLLNRISSFLFIYSVVFILIYTIYIQSIGSGNYIECGLFQVTDGLVTNYWGTILQSLSLLSATKGFHNKSNLKDLRFLFNSGLPCPAPSLKISKSIEYIIKHKDDFDFNPIALIHPQDGFGAFCCNKAPTKIHHNYAFQDLSKLNLSEATKVDYSS